MKPEDRVQYAPRPKEPRRFCVCGHSLSQHRVPRLLRKTECRECICPDYLQADLPKWATNS